MKKSLSISIFVLSLFAGSLTMVRPGEAAVVPFQGILPRIASTLSSPEAIARYMWKNFGVESDQANFGQEDHWQSPEELLATKKGDCEDFARFAYEILRLNGRKAFMVNIYDKHGYGHTVCVFSENGRYQAIDGTDVKRLNAATLTEVFNKIHPSWDNAAIVKAAPQGAHGIILKAFHRS